MVRHARTARSRAVVHWPSTGQPDAFLNTVPDMPSSRPRLVMRSAKLSSLPDSPSATTTQASLPDSTIMPLIRSSTATSLPSSTNMREPPMLRARSLTRKRVSSLTRPAVSSSNRM
jgi:hypothetical protein